MRYTIKERVKIPKIKPNYNIAPSHDVVPFWAKDINVGYKMINARAETISEKPAYRTAFKKRRCIVPVSGFYEWKPDGKTKRPFAIHPKDQSLLSLAGIWESWRPEKEKEIQSFSIAVNQANSMMSKIHDRMPVILPRELEEEWLDPNNEDIEKLKLF